MKSVQCFADFFVKVVGRFFSSQSEKVTTGIEKNNKPTRYNVLCRLHGELFSRQKRFCSLKGHGPLKVFFFNRRK
jgi:hypothetical protein